MTLPDYATSREASHIWERETNEHYVEEQWCSTRLFAEEPFKGEIYDPFCGFGRIVRASIEGGYDGWGSDVVDRGPPHFRKGDFWKIPRDWRAQNIVSNPPFDKFQEIALRCLEISTRKVALIWMVRRLPAAGKWLRSTPLAKILFLTPRPSMPPGHVITSGGKVAGGKQDFCWLIWDHDYKWPYPMTGWLERDARTPAPT